MLFGNRGRRSLGKRQRTSEAYQPHAEPLEDKTLLSQLLLGAGTPFNLAGQQTTAPNGPQTLGGQLPFIADSSGTAQTQGNQTTDPGLGVLETGNVQAQGVGYSVAALGDMNGDGSNDYLVGAPMVTRNGTVISPANQNGSQAFLVFGNRSATITTTPSWLSSTPEQRVGVINNLGQPGASPRRLSRANSTPLPIAVRLLAASSTTTTSTGSHSSPKIPRTRN